jgi:hypothetical protein
VLEMIEDDGGVALTVVDAKVDYGTRTLLRSWCIERPEAVIWMTLDPDPAALQPWPGASTTAGSSSAGTQSCRGAAAWHRGTSLVA